MSQFPQWQERFKVAMQAGVDRAMTILAETAAADARQSMGTNHGGVRSQPGQPPNTQSNMLRRSIVAAGPARTGLPGVSKWGANVPYAKTLEFGGTIKSKGKMMTIPLNPEAAKKSRRPGWDPRKEPGLFLLERPGRNPLLVKNHGAGRGRGGKGKGDRIELWFALVRQVRIEARPFMIPASRSAIGKRDRFMDAYRRGFSAAWRAA